MIYEAGIMETVKGIVTGDLFIIPVVTAALLAIFRVIPNYKIQATVGAFARWLGLVITHSLSKWKWTKPFWNGIIEPWFIDLVENTFGTFIKEFVASLHSDNKE